MMTPKIFVPIEEPGKIAVSHPRFILTFSVILALGSDILSKTMSGTPHKKHHRCIVFKI